MLGLLIGCGTTPPEATWDGSKEDSTAVLDSLDNWRWLFQSSYVFEKTLTPVTIAVSRIPLSDTFSQKFFPVAFQRVPTETTHLDSLIFAKDTTCTVYLIDEYKGKLIVKCDSFTPLVRIDTIIDTTETKIDTIFNNIYKSTFVAKDTSLSKDFRGKAWNAAFFDRDSAGIWSLQKIAGAIEFYFPDEVTAPLLYYLRDSVGSTVDTFWWRPSAGQFGAHWLYPLDSILAFGVNDTITLSEKYVVYAYMDSMPFIWLDSTRYEYDALYSNTLHAALFTFSTPGIHRLSFEVGSAEALYKPEKEYRGIMWGIPVRIR